MQFDLPRWKPLKYAGLVLAATGLFASVGCQKWSLRHSILGYDKDAADDWAPPVDESRPSLDKEPMVGQESRGRPWWGKNVTSQIPRVELPRNRAKREEIKVEDAKTAENKPGDGKRPDAVAKAPSPNASPTLTQPEPPVSSPTKPSDTPNVAAPSTLPPASNLATPGKSKEGALLSMGANPKSGPGPIVKSLSGDDAASPAAPSGATTGPASPKIVDTGATDVDIQGAIQSLPPEYRDIVVRTFQAMKDEKHPAEGALASIPSITPAQPVAQASIAESSATTPVVAEQAKSPGRVSVRLTGDDDTSAPTSTTQQPEFPKNEVAKAIATPEVPGQGAVVQSSAEEIKSTTPAASSPNGVGLANNVAHASRLTTSSNTTTANTLPVNNTLPAKDAGALPSGPSTPAVTDSSVRSSGPIPSESPNRNWYQANNDAIERLETALESTQGTDEALRRSQEITLRLLYVAQRRLEDALRPIDGLEEHEQEYVRHQMQALYEASNPDANPTRGRHWGTVMVSQREATSHLAAASNLEVRAVSFCTQVDGYGMVQKFARYQFTPDQDVLLYCEVDNVAAQQLKTGYETQLQGSYEIRDAQGRRVAEQILPMEPEICQNHRRDYFMVYRIYMPQQIPPGSYQLKLTIEDMKGKKFGHSTADFEIRK